MGYYTKYELSYDTRVVTESVEDITSYDNHYFTTGCKFYGNEKVLKDFSTKYPDVLFTLTGLGEEPDDQWIKYFKNGKMQLAKAKITFDSFDESKLA